MCSCDVPEVSVSECRPLHYVFKITDRRETVRFYKDILGMKVLRHEEYAENTEDAKVSYISRHIYRWSKTILGYGPEEDNFAIELNYIYTVKHYDRGNEFVGITLIGEDILKRAVQHNWPIMKGNILEGPEGYRFFISNKPESANEIKKVTLHCSNLNRTIDYWNSLLGLKVYARKRKSVELGFRDNDTKIEFIETGEPINRAQAFGRITFSCPHEKQPLIELKIRAAKQKILVPLTHIDTPGKATVRVIVLADPDGHEVCFVNELAFKELSRYAPEEEHILEAQIEKEERIMHAEETSVDND